MSTMSRYVVAVVLAGCGSSTPPSTGPEPTEVVAPAPIAVDAPPPDAGPSAAVAAAPPWIFRYNAGGRLETWTLRHAGGEAMLEVQSAQGTTRYLGTATEGASLALSVMSGANAMQLDCKRGKQPIGTKCGDPGASPMDVLDCYHPDFKTPMTFAPAPGAEFVSDGACTGYRLLAP